jgi:serine O-acetyltransferase
MKKEFYQFIYQQQKETETVPPNEEIATWVNDLICLLFPEKADINLSSPEEVELKFSDLRSELTDLLDATSECPANGNTEKANSFFMNIPELYRILNTDIEALLAGDPAARTRFEIIRAYPGFYAISFYRIAHALFDLDIPLLPRIITEYAHSKTGIDIHPAAEIGEYFFIDHGTGIVIGETTIIGDHVKLYQGVTLGALSVDKAMASVKRHPTVEDHVIIYSGATILGGETTIGHNSVIGGNVWLTKSVPSCSTVYHRPDIEVVEQIKS